MSMDRWRTFEARMREIKDLDGVLGLMSWDEETFAPKAGRGPRGRHNGTLEAIRHERLAAPELGHLIDALKADPHLAPDRATMVERLLRRRTREVAVPESLVRALAEARSAALAAWQDAKKAGDYPAFRPYLQNVVELTRTRAEAIAAAGGGGGGGRGSSAALYDVLLDEYEPGMTAARLAPLLARLKDGLLELLQTIQSRGTPPDRRFLSGRFPDAKQWALTLRFLADLGFDTERGRQDRSAHPFTSSVSEHDVRLTTRIFEDNLLSAIFSTVHEAGHGMYEQGFEDRDHGTLLADAPSMGIHESQSRLWENQVARSRAFWRRYLPLLKETFPAELAGADVEAFYRAVNVVEPGLVRVDADEVTYNLHILLRFEIELELIGGTLSLFDLPGAWNERMRRYLGVSPPHDGAGCMQDIHWAQGAIGYFPSYTLGNLYSAQLMAAFEREQADAWGTIERGEFGVLLGWLRKKVHRLGYRHTAEETVAAATGQPLAVEPFLGYLRAKFSDVYRF
jgi:carboxypeptidase Taq